jgi:hypothetical protein
MSAGSVESRVSLVAEDFAIAHQPLDAQVDRPSFGQIQLTTARKKQPPCKICRRYEQSRN